VSTSPISFSSSYPAPAFFGQISQPTSGQQYAQTYGSTSSVADDTVQISQLAQIQQMVQQGDSVSIIASTTGLSVNEIDSDLGITDTGSSISIAIPSSNGGGPAAAPVSESKTSNGSAGTSNPSSSGSTISVRA
jgi:hypothetical protein